MKLTDILAKNCVKVPLESTEKIAVITEMIDLLNDAGLLKDRKQALDTVLLREKTRSTGIGSSIAIPHGKCQAVNKLVMALGVAPEGIDFDSIDDKPVKTVILLVSPIDQTGPHIQALARISRLMLDENFKNTIENAKDPKILYDMISSKEAE